MLLPCLVQWLRTSTSPASNSQSEDGGALHPAALQEINSISSRKERYCSLTQQDVDKKCFIKLHAGRSTRSHSSSIGPCGMEHLQRRALPWLPGAEGCLEYKRAALCNQAGSLQPGGFTLKAAVCHPSRSEMKRPVYCREHLHLAAVSVGLTDDIATINNTRHPVGRNAGRAADCHRCTAAPYGVCKHEGVGEILTAAIEFS